MHTGITCTTHTIFGRLYTVYPTDYLHPLNTSITFNNKIATTPKNHYELFHQTTHKYCQTRTSHKTNRSINKATQKIQGYNITLTTTQVQDVIKQSKNNNSQGPDKLNIRHLKHIGRLGLAFLLSMFKTVLNNIISHIWKLASIVSIPKSNKDKGTS